MDPVIGSTRASLFKLAVQAQALEASDTALYARVTDLEEAPAQATAQDISSFRHAGESTLWYLANSTAYATIAGAGNYAANSIKAVPFIAPARGGTLDRIGFVVHGAGANNARIGLYSNTSDSNLYPAALLEDSGDISGATLGLKEHTISRALDPGQLYWLVYIVSGTAMTIKSLVSTNYGALLGINPEETTDITGHWGLTVAHTFGAFPDPFPAGAALQRHLASHVCPALYMRFSS